MAHLSNFLTQDCRCEFIRTYSCSVYFMRIPNCLCNTGYGLEDLCRAYYIRVVNATIGTGLITMV